MSGIHLGVEDTAMKQADEVSAFVDVIVWLGVMGKKKIFKLIAIMLDGYGAMEKTCGRRLLNVF